MRSILAIRFIAVAVCATPVGAAQAQTVYDWIQTGEADWNVNENWDSLFGSFVPDADQFPGDSATIGNGATAFIVASVPRISALTVGNGVVDIRGGGALEVVDDGVGNGSTTVGGAGSILLGASGQMTMDSHLSNSGTIQLTGPDASLEIGGDFVNAGTLVAGITDANDHSTVNVAGAATLGGTLQVAVSGVTPTIGQSWELLSAGSLSGAFSSVDSSASPPLDRGLSYQVTQTAQTASLSVGNALVLTVDRQTGAGAIENVIGGPIEITSYAIRSNGGLLSVDDWASVSVSNAAGAGWREANPTVNNLAELNLTNSFSLAVGESLDIGNPYNGGPSLPEDEDVQFEYTTLDGQLAQGIVEYTGAVNDFTLFVDPESGGAAIGNLSRFIETPVVTSYAVISESSSLVVENWTSFTDSGEAGEGWRTANPTSDHLAELNLTGDMAFTNGTLISLGNIFSTGGEQDLVLQYSTIAGDLLLGHIAYGEIPTPMPGGIPGDYNGNGQVEQGDLDLVLLNWGADAGSVPGSWVNDLPMGLVDQNELDGVLLNWGNAAAPGLAAAAVPEPASCGLLLAVFIFAACRLRKTGRQEQ